MENDKLVRMSDVERWILTESACIDTPADRDAVVERMRYSIPAVDAVEERHGRWEGNYPRAMFRLKRCSACETLAPEGWYCFWCGASMDGEEKRNAAD